MQTVNLTIDIIQETQFNDLPESEDVHRWFTLVLAHEQIDNATISLTYLPIDEMHRLNYQFRHKDKATNILSFPYEAPPGLPSHLLSDNFLGDLIVCPDILQQEANEQGKSLAHHQTHILIHGLLHLLGYDHIEAKDREQMEALEIKLLKQLMIPNPYDPEVFNG